MRSSDLLFGLLALVGGFGAVILAAPGGSPGGIGVALGFAVVMLAAMAWTMWHAPRVLVVGPAAGRRLHGMHDALDSAGFAVCSCPGPEARDCPAMRGLPCPVDRHPLAAVISTSPAYTGPPPPCGEALSIPTVDGRDATHPEAAARAVRGVAA